MPLPSIDPANYASQLAEKVAQFKLAFAPFAIPEPDVFPSVPEHYRLRAEFRIWHQGEQLDYAMFDPDNPKQPVMVEHFPMAAESICGLMPRLIERLRRSQTLRGGLFQVDFLATLSGELMVTLVYHRQLGTGWELAARDLASELNVQVIGRSRGQKVVLERDWLLEEFELNGRQLRYQQIEGSFTQPNGGVNRQMLGWACAQAATLGGDLLELYCGNGNFTIALAPLFERVLATEVSKSSVRAAAIQPLRQRRRQRGAGARLQRGNQRCPGRPRGAQADEGHRPRAATAFRPFSSTRHAVDWMPRRSNWPPVSKISCTSPATRKPCRKTSPPCRPRTQ